MDSHNDAYTDLETSVVSSFKYEFSASADPILDNAGVLENQNVEESQEGLDSLAIRGINVQENVCNVESAGISPGKKKKRNRKRNKNKNAETVSNTSNETAAKAQSASSETDDRDITANLSGKTVRSNPSKQNLKQSTKHVHSSQSSKVNSASSASSVSYNKSQAASLENQNIEKCEFFLSSASRDFGVADIRKNCQRLDVQVLKCFNISKMDRISQSFRLTVCLEDKQKILNKSSWPAGITVQPWKGNAGSGTAAAVSNGDIKDRIRDLRIYNSRRQGSYNLTDVTEVGNYCTDELQNFQHDRSELRYYVGPTLGGPDDPEQLRPAYDCETSLNLLHGFNSRIIPDMQEGLQTIFKWILQNQDSLSSVDFVCWRGLLTCVICSPFNKQKSWKVSAAKFRGVIYMCEMKTEEDLAIDRTTESSQKSTYCGFKFEQYVTSDSPGGHPDIESPVNTNKAFYTVVNSSLNQHRLLYAAEVDCCDVDNDKSYIELKTTNELRNEKDKEMFERMRLSQAWAQSYLIGVQKIVYGFRKNFRVTRIQTYNTVELPSIFSKRGASFSKDAGLEFCDRFLTHVRNVVKEDHDKKTEYVIYAAAIKIPQGQKRAVYVFERRPSSPVITSQKHTPEAAPSQILDWFISEMQTS